MRVHKKYIIGLVTLALAVLPLQSVLAVSSDSLYVYDLRNSTGVIANTAAVNGSVNMTLTGSWTALAEGTLFTGNIVNTRSVGYAKPATGKTLSVLASQAVGAAIIFTPNAICTADSQNLSQIGAFATGTTQVKLQISKCVSGATYPECRIAGLATPANTLAFRGTANLSAGVPYRLECVKGPDQGSSAPLVMRLTDLSTGLVSVTNLTIPASGAMSSSAYVTAANKYPLPTQPKNTDQFNGVIAELGYCKSASLLAAQACLEAEVAN